MTTQSSTRNQNQPRRGPMGHGGPMGGPMGMMGGEKARDFKGTLARLVQYLAPYRLPILVVMLFAAASTIFNIIGPKILGKATTRLFEGVMAQISGPAPGLIFHTLGEYPDYHRYPVPAFLLVYVHSEMGYVRMCPRK